jgi:hypothetical protein
MFKQFRSFPIFEIAALATIFVTVVVGFSEFLLHGITPFVLSSVTLIIWVSIALTQNRYIQILRKDLTASMKLLDMIGQTIETIGSKLPPHIRNMPFRKMVNGKEKSYN